MSPAFEFTGLKVPEGGFGAVSIDPPWTYKARSEKGMSRSPARHYRTMSVDQIRAIPVRDICAKNAWLFLWTTGSNMHTAIDILQTSWGFKYSSVAFVWVKLNRTMGGLFYDRKSFWVGTGHTTRKNAEFCLLGRIGRPRRRPTATNVQELILAPRREHSRKPDEAYERIQQFCTGPYVEIFGREQRPAWTTWGDEAEKFSRGRTAA